MSRKAPQTYNVTNESDGSLVVIGVDLATARSEHARLNAEARMVAAERPGHAGMHMGDVAQHAITPTQSSDLIAGRILPLVVPDLNVTTKEG